MDDPLLSGDGSVADLLQNAGGAGNPYITNQTPYDEVDDGTLQSTAGTVTAANGQPTGTSGNSSNTVAPWYQSILNLAQGAATTVTQVAPLINGRPAAPSAPGAQPNATGVVPNAGFGGIATVGLVIAAIVLFLIFGKKK